MFLLPEKLQRLIGALVPPPYRSFSELEEGQVKTSDVMSCVRSSRDSAAVTSLSPGRLLALPAVAWVPAVPVNGSEPFEAEPYMAVSVLPTGVWATVRG